MRPALRTLGLAAALGLASTIPAEAQPPRFKAPAPWRVYQRDASGKARVALVPEDPSEVKEILGAEVVRGGPEALPAGVTTPGNRPSRLPARLIDGALELPTGGPYTVVFRYKSNNGNNFESSAVVGPIFIGDLWVLAGQSNMEGVGDLIDVAPPHPRVAVLAMDGAWARAEEPLHWLFDSPDPVHSGDPATREERAAQQRRTRTKGAGLGLPFATALTDAIDVPIGLVACAHGGTSMEQWNPSKKSEGGNSLYGSMLRQVKLAGGKVKGVLWYQGESDALGGEKVVEAYPKVFADFIAAVRADLETPDLPFLLVQIGRFVRDAPPGPWNAVQDAQRRIPERVPGTAVVATVDLELDDLIHVGTQGLKRLGRRLARVAERNVYGRAGATTPTFARATPGPGNTLLVEFRGVNVGEGPQGGGLAPRLHIAGFSIRKADGAEVPLIYEAAVGPSRDAVVLKLTGPVPEGARLWYGHGLDPYCNLADGLDMAVPAFGPVPLDAVK